MSLWKIPALGSDVLRDSAFLRAEETSFCSEQTWDGGKEIFRDFFSPPSTVTLLEVSGLHLAGLLLSLFTVH